MENAMNRRWITPTLLPLQPTDWFNLASILAVAVAIRILFFTGFFGSDEVTYIETAANIAAGDWRPSSYVGAARYGMNLPVALFIYLFGLSYFSANLWPFLCSVGEVATVYFIARWLWDARTAALCAILLALLPLHVTFAGRLMADPPLAFFLTLSVGLLLRASRSSGGFLLFAAGLTWGAVFWVKESVAILYAPVFLLLALNLNPLGKRWFWLLAGMTVAVLANCALMYFVAGNPLHVFAIIKGGLGTYQDWNTTTSPWYYFHYLSLDIRHTFLLGFFAVGGIILYGMGLTSGRPSAPGVQFVAIWMVLMVALFSFAVVSVSPVKLVMKQANYMLIFMGPMALLAGWFLAQLPRKLMLPLVALSVAGSVMLAAFEQQAVAVFTANSKAGYVYLREHPNSVLMATTNNLRAVNFFSMMENRRDLRDRVMSFGELSGAQSASGAARLTAKAAGGTQVYALLDLQTIGWGLKPGGIRRLEDVPKCWTPISVLAPAPLGSGSWLVGGAVALGGLLPDSARTPYMKAMQPISTPLSAHLFQVPPTCLGDVARDLTRDVKR